MITWLQKKLSRKFSAFLCGEKDGAPPWLEQVSQGDAEGLFHPSEAPWIVHSDFATLIGGVRALLLQALHPGSLAGVHGHSRYKQDPLGRLAGTIQWLTLTTFASKESVHNEAERVKQLHAKVRGKYHNAHNQMQDYSADDTHLLLWVHIAFMESFLRCHENFSQRKIPGGADAYVHLWAKSVAQLGADHAPQSEQEMIDMLDSYQKELCSNEKTKEVIFWLRNPPLPFLVKPIYAVLFHCALATMNESHKKLLAIKTYPLWLMKRIGSWMLWTMSILLGKQSPIEKAALQRMGL